MITLRLNKISFAVLCIQDIQTFKYLNISHKHLTIDLFLLLAKCYIFILFH
jgi:hypothetical protein